MKFNFFSLLFIGATCDDKFYQTLSLYHQTYDYGQDLSEALGVQTEDITEVPVDPNECSDDETVLDAEVHKDS